MIDLNWKSDAEIDKEKDVILAIKFIHPFEDDFNYAITKVNLNSEKTNINGIKFLDLEKYVENLNKDYEILGIDLGDIPEDYCFDEEVYITGFKTKESVFLNRYKLKITINEDCLDLEMEILDKNGIYKDEVYKTELDTQIHTVKFVNNLKRDEDVVRNNVYAVVGNKEVENGIDIFDSKQLSSYYKETFGFKKVFLPFERNSDVDIKVNTNLGMNELIYGIYMETKLRENLRDYNNPCDILEENKTFFEKHLLNTIMKDCVEDIINSYAYSITKAMGVDNKKLPTGNENQEYANKKLQIYRRVLTNMEFTKYESLEDFLYSVIKEILREYSNEFFNKENSITVFVPYKVKNFDRMEVTSSFKAYYDEYYKRINIEMIKLSLINYKEYTQDVYTPSLYGFRMDLN